jgi:hypothetical protein
MPEQGPYTYTPTAASQFERLGHPGKYITSYQYSSGDIYFTGSNYGYGSIMVVAAGGATASLSNGGTLNLGDLNVKNVYDFSISRITGGTASSIYLFKRQGVA